MIEPRNARTGKLRVLAALSVAAALVMTVLPIPAWASPFWPEWTVLVVIYWCIALPHRFNLKFAWTAGLLMDLIKGSLLGQHALAYLLVAYICIHVYQRLRIYPLLQQAFSVGALMLPYFLLSLGVESLLHPDALVDWRYWTPIAGSVLLWPWVLSILRLLRQTAAETRVRPEHERTAR